MTNYKTTFHFSSGEDLALILSVDELEEMNKAQTYNGIFDVDAGEVFMHINMRSVDWVAIENSEVSA